MCLCVLVKFIVLGRWMFSSTVVDRVSSSTFMELLAPHRYSLNLINGLAVTVAHFFLPRGTPNYTHIVVLNLCTSTLMSAPLSLYINVQKNVTFLPLVGVV